MLAARGSRSLHERLSAVAERALLSLASPASTVEIFLLSSEEMHNLEKKVGMQRAGHVPNVLSFGEPEAFPHPETKKKMLGEVYLNKDLAVRGVQDLAYLLVHGILHLMGYSHAKKNDTLEMEHLEQQICEKIFRDPG